MILCTNRGQELLLQTSDIVSDIEMKRSDATEDQRCSLTGPSVPVLVMTDDQAQPVPEPSSQSLYVDILTARTQQLMPLRPSLPCTFTPEILSGVTQ